MNPILLKSILAMDSYNRGYGAGINLEDNAVGNATIKKTLIDGIAADLDSGVIRDPITGERLDDNISFYAISYDYDGNADGITDETIISFRGTDDVVNDVLNGYYAYVFCPKRFACSSP